MKINLSSIERKKVTTLLEAKEININLADMFLCLFNDPNAINENDINIEMLENNKNKHDAYIAMLLDYLQIDSENEENEKFINQFISPCIKEVNSDFLKENKYYQTIKPICQIEGEYSLTYDQYQPYELFALDEINVDEQDNFKEYSKLGFSSKTLPFLALKRKNTTWMSIIPSEINSMESNINNATGNVLIMGLGLGYFPFMISDKKEVTHITIIENDKTIINIFKKHIFPIFPNKNKIKIICDDALNFLNNNKINYDYCFVDLWHNANDGLPIYLRFKEIEKKSNIKVFDYWLETSIIALYRRAFLTVLEEQLNGSTDKNYQNSENELDDIINKIYFKTKTLQINSYNQIIEILKNLKF